MDIERLDTHGKSVRPSLVGHGVAEFSLTREHELVMAIYNYRAILNDTEILRLDEFIKRHAKERLKRHV